MRSAFEPWQGQYKRLRGEDELLRYLTHARNADTHTIQEIVERKPGHSTISPVGFGPEGWYIESMTIVDGRLVEYQGSLPIEHRTYPARLELLPIVDRGVRFDPPSQHLGVALERRDPLAVGELGWKFYLEFVDEVEGRFFTSPQ